jgi:hypothetical protein
VLKDREAAGAESYKGELLLIFVLASRFSKIRKGKGNLYNH